MHTNCMMLARSAGASMLICSGVIERTLINMACKTYITFLFNDAIGKVYLLIFRQVLEMWG